MAPAPEEDEGDGEGFVDLDTEYGAGFTKSGTKRGNESDRRMRVSLALTALAMQPSSRRVRLTLSGVKTPPDS